MLARAARLPLGHGFVATMLVLTLVVADVPRWLAALVIVAVLTVAVQGVDTYVREKRLHQCLASTPTLESPWDSW